MEINQKHLAKCIETARKFNAPRQQVDDLLHRGHIPLPWQWEFHAIAREADRKGGPVDIGLGGARGPGKSHAILAQVALDDCQRVNGLKGLFLRQTGVAAQESFSDLIDKVVVGRVEYRRTGQTLSFPNNSRIILGGFKDERDIDKYIGIEYDVIIVEELNQLTEDKHTKLRGSLRTSKPNWRPRLYTSFNPGGIGHCIPSGQVLTPEGWIEISDVKVDDYVLSDDDGETKFVKVDQVIKEDYNGNLYQSSNWSARFVCTPEHKIVRVTETKNKNGRVFHKPSLIEVKDLPEVTRLPKVGVWAGIEIEYFDSGPRDKKSKLNQPRFLSGDNYCRLMGWFLSEGYVGNGYFGISQTKLKQKKLIEKLLDNCGFKYNWNGASVDIYSKSWADYFSVFGKCRDKFVPRILREAPVRQLKLFYETMMLGDGCGIHYYTISKQLADDMCDVGIKMGFRIYLSSRQRKNRIGLSYDISFKENKLGWIEKKNIKKIKYSGKVYCLGIDNLHRFYLRQNGSVYLSGNSFVRDRYVIPHREKREKETRFIGATYKANPHLNIEYIEYLEGLTGDLGKAWREGEWEIFAGQVFSEWRQSLHVIKRIIPRKNVTDILGMDWGYAKTSAFAATLNSLSNLQTQDGQKYNQIVTYREWYGNLKSPREWARIIYHDCVKMNKHPKRCISDPSMHSTQTGGNSIAMTIEKEWKELNGGINWCRIEKGSNSGRNSRVNRVGMMHEWLSINPATKIPYWVITENCFNVIRSIPMLVHDTNLVEAYSTSGDDHCADQAAYLFEKIKFVSVKPGSYSALKGEKKVYLGTDERGLPIVDPKMFFGTVS